MSPISSSDPASKPRADGGGPPAPSIERLVAELYRARNRSWSVALVAGRAFLDSIGDELLADDDRDRLDASSARVKKRSRTAEKVRRKVDEGVFPRPMTPADVEAGLHDIVGIKVLCKSPRDLHAFTRALEAACEPADAAIRFAVPPIDYVSHPKPSGYRAYHAVIAVPVATHQGVLPIKVEVQVKTRLQDAWSELTHEDMYRPGEALVADPDHERYARQMADLLASVDAMADDLARELDSVTSADPSDDPAPLPNPPVSARVTMTGPKYALAVGADGRRGLIPAKSVRELLGTTDRIRVSDYLEVGDEVLVVRDETATALYLHPVALPSLRAGDR